MVKTMANNLLNVKVMGEVIGAELPHKLKFTPLAVVSTELQGVAGDTITKGKYAYIGEAVDVAVGQAIPESDLNMTSQDVKVKKAGNGFVVTDEDVKVRGNEVIEEGKRQLLKSIADKIDSDSLNSLLTTTLTTTVASTLGYDAIVDGVGVFAEEDDEARVIFIAPEQKITLLKDPNFIRASEMGDKTIMTGVIGEIAGCQVVVSRKVKKAGDKFNNLIVKAGALGIEMAKIVNLEEERSAKYKKSGYYADEFYATYLRDESKCVKLVVNA